MSRNNDDGIEGFFRKAANQSDSSYLKEDWRKMEKMLDDEFGPSGVALPARGWRQPTAVVAILVIVSAIVYLSMREGGLLVSEVTPAAPTQAADRDEVFERAERSADLPSEERGDPGQTAARATDEPSPQRSATSRNDVMSLRGPSASRDGQGDTFSTTHAIGAISDPAVMSPAADHDLSAAVAGSGAMPVSEHDSTEQEGLEELPAFGPGNEAEPRESTDDQRMSPSRWFVTLAVAPDFSTTALNRYSAPGSAFGLIIGYRFHERLHLTAGVVKSFKRYRGYGHEYTPPEGYWERRTNGVVPDLVDGQCNVVEIPIAVRADLYAHTKNRFYTTLGASGYIMLDESYSYTFYNPNPGADGSWSSDRTSRYNFAALNVSLGYERVLFGNTSLGVEPYVKMPMAGIGWTDIKLFSAGAYVTLRYGISGTRSKINP